MELGEARELGRLGNEEKLGNDGARETRRPGNEGD